MLGYGLSAQADQSDCIPASGVKKLGGRAWNSRTGWIANDFEVNSVSGPKPHCFLGLQGALNKLLPVGEVKGWSWSRFGYICWGATCKDYASISKGPNGATPKV